MIDVCGIRFVHLCADLTDGDVDRVIIAGQGEVGQAAREVIAEEGLDITTIDIEDRDGVDIVGDAGSDEILQTAEIETAGAIIVGLPDDSASLLTTVLARSLNSNIEVLTDRP